MPARANRYNDPAIGAVFENIASMFAPPSAQETAAYAAARGENQKADIIEKLRADPRYAGADAGVLANLFDPTQSWAAQDQNTATARRGQDVTANTAIRTNALDNQVKLALPRFSPLDPGQALPAVQGSLASQFGLPSDLSAVAGPPKPLSETEARGAIITGAPPLTNDQTTALVMGSTPTQNVVDPVTGKPVVSYTPGAVGAEPVLNKGAESKPDFYRYQTPDGRTGTATTNGDKLIDAASGEELPQGTQIAKTSITATSAEGALGKPTTNYIDRALIDIAVAKDTAVKLRDLIASAPASQGAVGWLRGTAQNVIQVGGEVGTFFGGQVAEIAKDIESGAADAGLAGAFDPNIPAIEMMANLLAFQYAKTTTGERLSNEMLKAARSALGLDGLDANQASSLARLNQAISQIAAQEEILKKAKGQGVDALSTPAADAAAATPTSDEEYAALPSGTLFVDPEDGQTYRKP